MTLGGEAAVLDFIREPIIILDTKGVVQVANSAAERFVGIHPGAELSTVVATPIAELRDWLRRCSGSTAPLVGSLEFKKAEEPSQRYIVYGARLQNANDPARLIVRFEDPQENRFSLLKKEVQQLNAEAADRRRKQAVLEEALRQNEVLLHELNHRAKNNIQIIANLLSITTREADSEHVKAVLEPVMKRLFALGAAQELMYESSRMNLIPGGQLVRKLAGAIAASLGPGTQLTVEASEGTLSNDTAFPLALILNELITNAAKHGSSGAGARIRVLFERQGGELSLVVQDEGPGMRDEGRLRRSSGLGLVRGLCRQIGAQLLITNENGVRCEVRFAEHQTTEN